MSVTMPRKRSSKTKARVASAGSGAVNEIAKLLVSPPLQGPLGEAHEIEVIVSPTNHAFIEAWERFSELHAEENPFLSPQFMVPALAHLVKETPLTLVATWQKQGRDRQLTGLFPLISTKRHQSLRAWMFGVQCSLWKHELLPFSGPLLSDDPDVAEASIAAFVNWLLARRPRVKSFAMPSLRTDGKTSSMLEAEFRRHGIVVESNRDEARSRGLNFRPSQAPECAKKVTISRGVSPAKETLEKALCLDVLGSRRSEAAAAVLESLETSSFVRAVVRGFAAIGRVSIAHIDEPDARASAIIIEGAQTAYLWWVMGPDACNPMIEASLCAAAEAALGKKIMAATVTPASGIWVEPIRTTSMKAHF